MPYDNDLIAAKLRRWEKYLDDYNLPEWETIPDFGLYMEQVTELLKQYLDYLPPELKEEQFITAATINNYVRTQVMPHPVKKKYYRVHIAYLIIILTLKTSMSIAMIQKLIPMGISDEEVHSIYSAFSHLHGQATKYFSGQVRAVAGPILRHDDLQGVTVERTEDLIAASAVICGLTRLFAEKLMLLDGRTMETEKDRL